MAPRSHSNTALFANQILFIYWLLPLLLNKILIILFALECTTYVYESIRNKLQGLSFKRIGWSDESSAKMMITNVLSADFFIHDLNACTCSVNFCIEAEEWKLFPYLSHSSIHWRIDSSSSVVTVIKFSTIMVGRIQGLAWLGHCMPWCFEARFRNFTGLKI